MKISKHAPLLAPSVLAGDHAHLASALKVVADTGLEWVHLDMMDGHFVPNLSFGPQTVADLRKRNSELFFDTHLMFSRPDRFLEAYAEAGSDQISVHVEAQCDPHACIERIHALGCKAGIVINPGTEAESIRPFLGRVELVLVMTVWPGFGGQSFIDETLAKMEQLAAWRSCGEGNFRLQVDGGINLETAKRCHSAGVDTFVAGTSFFRSEDPREFARVIAQMADGKAQD